MFVLLSSLLSLPQGLRIKPPDCELAKVVLHNIHVVCGPPLSMPTCTDLSRSYRYTVTVTTGRRYWYFCATIVRDGAQDVPRQVQGGCIYCCFMCARAKTFRALPSAFSTTGARLASRGLLHAGKQPRPSHPRFGLSPKPQRLTINSACTL